MQVVIGIDVGGSTTKIVGFRTDGGHADLIAPLFVRAEDPITSVYGAFGKFTAQNRLSLAEIGEVRMTGVGASQLGGPIYDLPCVNVPEFRSIGRGGLYLSGLSEAIIVSMGTGTAIVHAKAGAEPDYLGGTGVGGGTLLGLSKKLLGMDDIRHIEEIAREGDLSKVDLRIGDIDKQNTLPGHMTAANFGKVSDLASPADLALGVMNMVFETAGMLALFAARSCGLSDIVLTGNLTRVPYAKEVFANMSELFHVRFLIPEMAEFSTVIGTALGH